METILVFLIKEAGSAAAGYIAKESLNSVYIQIFKNGIDDNDQLKKNIDEIIQKLNLIENNQKEILNKINYIDIKIERKIVEENIKDDLGTINSIINRMYGFFKSINDKKYKDLNEIKEEYISIIEKIDNKIPECVEKVNLRAIDFLDLMRKQLFIICHYKKI